MLGEFEYFVLSAATRLGVEAYGVTILRDVEATTGRPCSIGALYTTLARLESKGLIKTCNGDPTPERGGRAKKMVRLTAHGLREARAFHDAVAKASHGIDWSPKGSRA